MDDMNKQFRDWFSMFGSAISDLEIETIARMAFAEGWKSAQQSVQRTADHVCLCGVGDPLNMGKDIMCPIPSHAAHASR